MTLKKHRKMMDAAKAMTGSPRQMPPKAKGQPSSGSERRLVRDLINVGSGKIPHKFMGQCPDSVDGHDQRDKTCRACRILIRAKYNIANRGAGAGQNL
jgi:hypothetical protein